MLFLLFPQTLTQGVIHNMNDSSGESLIQIKNLTAAVRLNNGDTLVTVNNASMVCQFEWQTKCESYLYGRGQEEKLLDKVRGNRKDFLVT